MLPGGCRPAQPLTSLSLAGRWMGGQRPLQQFFAQPLALPLRQLRLALNMRLPKLDLSHCNQLQELSMSSTWNLPRGSALPLQLQRLELFRESGDGESLEELQLQQLQYASLHIPMTAQSLHEMTQLQALQHVALGYNDAAAAVVAAATWQQLPQLRELTVAYTHGKPDRDQMSEILAGVEACSSLTKLKLEVRAVRFEQEEEEEELEYGDDPEMVDERVPACGALAGLTNLRDLRIVNTSQLPHGDALQPTALTGLTSLVLAGLGEGVGELAANALACCQKQLRHLDLQDCDLGSMSCLAAVAHLSQLTELKLEGNSGLARQGLLLLTRLSNLPKLGVEHDRLLTPHAWQRFWAAVHRQQQA
ncbi:hypothetical protein COO60DRAFT_319982 [Scenedesmus sp. NREL 46B-D3]|nr:hypothetical protein COO60DRAFT_319982 [Scenedesmus sp. NREL 46B-D3]